MYKCRLTVHGKHLQSFLKLSIAPLGGVSPMELVKHPSTLASSYFYSHYFFPLVIHVIIPPKLA